MAAGLPKTENFLDKVITVATSGKMGIRDLTLEALLTAYESAVRLGLNQEFIELLQVEIDQRIQEVAIQ